MRFHKAAILLSTVLLACCDAPPDNVSSAPADRSAAPASGDDLPETVTFNAHIRPILSDTCFACHGFDAAKREADLRLDTPEGAYAALKDSDGRAIVPGKPDESAVLARMFSNDPDEVMPPPEFHKELTARQKALVRKWIEQGAKYERHWSFAGIVRPEVPKSAKNPIDAFILARLEKEGIEPSPNADKATLLRRLSLDLTGLPPGPAELDAFLADESPAAYERQVERLLASPHYGERMAVPWLDAVRYADTVGYHGDQNLRVFPYRDYVIKAFNDNMPFDRFTIEQLAGDLLPDATEAHKIATGFLRLNMMTREGGAQPAEYLAKYTGDRVRAIGAAWLGLTTGCAECHDHKFDPFTARDFYSLGAFFADVRQWGVYSDYSYTRNPDLAGSNNEWPFPPEIHSRNAALEKRIAMLKDKGVVELAGNLPPQAASSRDSWARQAAAFVSFNPDGWQVLRPVSATASKGTRTRMLPDGSVSFVGPVAEKETLTMRLELPDVPVRSIRFEALPDPDQGGTVGRQPDGKFRVTPAFALVAGEGAASPLAVAWSQADRRTPHQYSNGQTRPLLEPEWRSAPAKWEEPLDAAKHPQHAHYHLKSPLPAAPGRVIEITLASADISRVRFSITPFGDSVPGERMAMRPELAASLAAPEASRTASQQREINAAFLQGTLDDDKLPAGYRTIRAGIIECRAGYAHSVIAQSLPADRILKVHLLPRGNWMTPGEEVRPAFPAFLTASAAPEGARLSRLDLARWLVSDNNPLTARHFVNRLWKQFFGKGLSGVLDDLGSQGELPSHPELLDWLASEFRGGGWDVKHVVKLIVTSETYQRRSTDRPQLLERDPANRLLASQSPRRLDAEFVRDNALAVAGLLDTDITGGPSAMPYQPAGYYQNLNFPERDYHASPGDLQYRRGLYMHWQRTFIHPMLANFDAPSREECAADRFQSNSPQQALTLLNDPSFVEAARVFAARLVREVPQKDDAGRISHAIRLALGRSPRAGETESLAAFLETQRKNYGAKPDDATKLLATGQSPPTAGDNPAELAAWTQLCRVILNLHETITRY